MQVHSKRPPSHAVSHGDPQGTHRLDSQIRYHFETDRIVMAMWENVGIHVWARQANKELVDKLDEISHEEMRRHPNGASAVHIVVEGTPLPDPDARVGFAQISKRYADQIGCVVTLIEGDGFWRSAMRSFVTGLHWVDRQPFFAKICATIEEVARTVPEPHRRRTGVEVSPATLQSALREVRERVKR